MTADRVFLRTTNLVTDLIDVQTQLGLKAVA